MESEGTSKKNYRNNPRKNASFFSLLGFCWTVPLFIKGFRHDLEEEDLYEPLLEHKSSHLGDQLEAEWQKELKKKSPELWKAMSRVFGLKFAAYGFVIMLLEGLKISQPLWLSKLLVYFRPDQTNMTQSEAYLYAGLIFGTSFLNVIGGHLYMFGLQHLGMKIRIACCSLVYRKSLKLSRKAMGETTIGQMVNLLSNDVNRFDRAVINLHNLWLAPIESLIISYLMYSYVGFTSSVGVGFLLLYIPLQMYLGRKYSSLRMKTALKTDERVRLMNEIVTGIEVLKMYTWEKPFAKLVEIARKVEIKYIRNTAIINGVILSLAIFSTRLAVFITVVTYVLLGNSLTPEYVFVIYSFYNILRQSMTIYLPHGISQYAEAKVSIKRIKKFLLYDEMQKSSIQNGVITSQPTDSKIVFKKATAKWSEEVPDNTLCNINLSVKDKELVAVIGAVGSGKTSLLQAILNELPLEEGELDVKGSLSYACQESWLFGGSVKQNILFGNPYEEKKYQEVIKVCALERDFKLFPHGDQTLVGERGIMVSGGQKARINLARAVYKDADIYLLDDPLSAVDTHVGKQLFEDCIQNYLHDKCVILVTHQLQYLKNLKHIVLLDKGEVRGEGTYNDIQSMEGAFTKLMKPEKEVNAVEEIKKLKSMESVIEQVEEQETIQEKRNTGTIKGSVYKAYISAWGNCCVSFTILSMFIWSQLSASGGDMFLTYWVNTEQNNYISKNASSEDGYLSSLSRNNFIYIYTFIIIFTVIIALIRTIGFFLMCMRASSTLHDKMFSSLVFSPMKFFNTNTSGRILNRFSKDIGSVDETLPTVTTDTIQIGLTVLGISIVIAFVTPMFLVVTCIILSVFYAMRVGYLRTSRDVKRLEGTTRSPVFTHISASLQGLTTIRAFDAETVLIKEFDHFQDIHSSAWFMFLSTSRTFGYWLDLISSLYVGLVTLSFVFMDSETYGGNVGLAISQSLGLTGMFQWGMRQWSELENQMTSVERVVEYTTLEKERTTVDKPNTKKWPGDGQIEFRTVFMRYSPTDPYVLKQLSFVINPREKIGIVGRTGAGKSSLIVALFQLSETEGDILIDDVNVHSITLQELRSNISIIPQEPVLFSGTMRKNLDPFDEFSDVELWSALEEVELKTVLSELPTGLNTRMLEGGTNFSVGQRQLICLARAIVRKNKILVLDEATANVDPQTDSLIQQTIRRKFSDCTVLTIAHRLNTIMDSDRVLVMDSGSVREFDHPFVLLQNKDGYFTKMIEKTGSNMAETLREISKTAYENQEK